MKIEDQAEQLSWSSRAKKTFSIQCLLYLMFARTLLYTAIGGSSFRGSSPSSSSSGLSLAELYVSAHSGMLLLYVDVCRWSIRILVCTLSSMSFASSDNHDRSVIRKHGIPICHNVVTPFHNSLSLLAKKTAGTALLWWKPLVKEEPGDRRELIRICRRGVHVHGLCRAPAT